MNKMVSARIHWHKDAHRPLNHGLNHAPNYVDPIIENDLWVFDPANPLSATHHRYRRGEPSGKAQYAVLKATSQTVMDDQAGRYLAHNNRKLPSNANHFCELLITFSRSVDPHSQGDALDQCTFKLAHTFAGKHHVRVIAVQRHNDEGKVHYHCLCTALSDKTHRPITKSIKKGDLSNLQDMAGHAFSPLGIQRGTKTIEKLKQTATENPRQEGESENDYTRRLFKLANVRNKTVAELHATLEADLDALEIEAAERQQQLADGDALKADELAAIAEQERELSRLRALVEGLDAERDRLCQEQAETQRGINQKTEQLTREQHAYAQLKAQERAVKQPEIGALQQHVASLERELKAAQRFLPIAARTLSRDVDRKAPYLKTPSKKRTQQERDQVTEFRSAAKKVSKTPTRVLDDLAQPEGIASWVRMLEAKRVFHGGLERIKKLLSLPLGKWVKAKRHPETELKDS
ncbi:hypothetical protein [Motiliproteus sp. SC1-56]|uniref:hypothetical protein n=1 Tax=Motiliproteus sp. SC1-56 TaxID=2799565 RepID=UPI001A8FE35F|nr:hypothetical protein [Motiliproteus sp. SC1-56]